MAFGLVQVEGRLQRWDDEALLLLQHYRCDPGIFRNSPELNFANHNNHPEALERYQMQ